jgi:kanosamine 6-kinase
MNTLALDLGGTTLSVRLTTEKKVINQTLRLPVSDHYGNDISLINDFITKITGNKTINGAAISSAATIDDNGWVIRWPNRPSWEGRPFRNDLEKMVGCAAIVEDDGNAAAIAEATLLSVRDLIFLGIGTGIGGGLILDGAVYRGFRMQAAEIGHMLISSEGPKCNCGRHGCLQAYASGKAIRSSAFPDNKDVSENDFRAAYEAKSEKTVLAFETAAKALAAAIISLSEIFDPKTISIGGGIGINFPEWIRRTIALSSALLRKGQTLPEIRPSAYGVYASLEGADVLAKKSALQNI